MWGIHIWEYQRFHPVWPATRLRWKNKDAVCSLILFLLLSYCGPRGNQFQPSHSWPWDPTHVTHQLLGASSHVSELTGPIFCMWKLNNETGTVSCVVLPFVHGDLQLSLNSTVEWKRQFTQKTTQHNDKKTLFWGYKLWCSEITETNIQAHCLLLFIALCYSD